MAILVVLLLYGGILVLCLIYDWIREERRRYRDREKLREFLQGVKT